MINIAKLLLRNYYYVLAFVLLIYIQMIFIEREHLGLVINIERYSDYQMEVLRFALCTGLALFIVGVGILLGTPITINKALRKKLAHLNLSTYYFQYIFFYVLLISSVLILLVYT